MILLLVLAGIKDRYRQVKDDLQKFQQTILMKFSVLCLPFDLEAVKLIMNERTNIRTDNVGQRNSYVV